MEKLRYGRVDVGIDETGHHPASRAVDDVVAVDSEAIRQIARLIERRTRLGLTVRPVELADERFAACDDSYVPDAAYLWVDACSAIAAFNQECFGIEPNLAGCLLEAQRYTPTSFSAYADCLVARDCDDAVGQAALVR